MLLKAFRSLSKDRPFQAIFLTPSLSEVPCRKSEEPFVKSKTVTVHAGAAHSSGVCEEFSSQSTPPIIFVEGGGGGGAMLHLAMPRIKAPGHQP